MGYRSDVRIVTTIEGYKKLNEFVKDYIGKFPDDQKYNLLNNCDIKRKDGEIIYFGWNWVKWYEGDYTDVNSIMKGLESLEENDYSYRYGRLGESYDDYEEKYYESSRKNEVELNFPMINREFYDAEFDYLEDVIEEKERDEEIENNFEEI